MKKNVIILIISLIFFNLPFDSKAEMRGKEFVEICKIDQNICTLVFSAAKSGATTGHKIAEVWRTDSKPENIYNYFCWDDAAKVTEGEHLKEFFSALSTSDLDFQNNTLGSLIALYLRMNYPPC